MSFKDYRKFAKREEQNKEPEVIQNNEDVINNEEIDENVEIIVNESMEDVELKAEITTTGVVTANKLNVRKEASKESDVLVVVSKGTGLGVNLTNSTDEFYCVNVLVNNEMTTGYVMKEFVTVNK